MSGNSIPLMNMALDEEVHPPFASTLSPSGDQYDSDLALRGRFRRVTHKIKSRIPFYDTSAPKTFGKSKYGPNDFIWLNHKPVPAMDVEPANSASLQVGLRKTNKCDFPNPAPLGMLHCLCLISSDQIRDLI